MFLGLAFLAIPIGKTCWLQNGVSVSLLPGCVSSTFAITKGRFPMCGWLLSLSGFKRSVYTICWAPILRKRRCLSVHVVGVINRGVIFWVPLRIVTNTTLCLVVVVCCTDDAGMILRSHWALEFAFPSVLLSLLIFLSCFCSSNCTRIYTTTTTPPRSRRGLCAVCD